MTRDAKIVLAVLAPVPAFIAGAATLCTWVIANGASMRWRLLFRMICHGIPERCLELSGVPMPICARCFGIYIGVLAGLVAFATWQLLVERRASARRMSNGALKSAAPLERILRTVSFVAVTPLAIDGLTQLTGLRESTNALRIATGLIAGLAFGLWILSAVQSRNESIVTTS